MQENVDMLSCKNTKTRLDSVVFNKAPGGPLMPSSVRYENYGTVSRLGFARPDKRATKTKIDSR